LAHSNGVRIQEGSEESVKGSDVGVLGVCKSFGDFQALKSVSMDIKKGEFFSLLGPSGCGKTTLLRIIAGFEQPDTGQVTFDGQDVLPLPPNKRHSNTVFQSYALFPHLTVAENIAFPLRIKKVRKDIIRSRVKDYIDLVELEGHADKKPALLSGGQRQRVAIARALINEPKVLLLDEPLSALDAKLRQHMLIELDKIHDIIGITFIYVTHDQTEALSVSDRIAVMNQGNVLQIGTPHEIYERPADNFVAQFIGETNLFHGVVRAIEGDYMTIESPELGTCRVQTDQKVELGARVSFTVRPEKVRILKERPTRDLEDLNIHKGVVDEPIYSGFQSKFYVRVEGGASFKVFKQHKTYSEEGPDIHWKDEVHVFWSAHDAYIVEGYTF
jgi:spermidine/putrescine transport system ATP-binding protein